MWFYWLPFEVFLGLFCKETYSFVVTPLIFSIWAFETRFLWSENPTSTDAIWAKRGRVILLLFFCLFPDIMLIEKVGCTSREYSIFMSILGILVEITPPLPPVALNSWLLIETMTGCVVFSLIDYEGNKVLAAFFTFWVFCHLCHAGVPSKIEFKPVENQQKVPASEKKTLPEEDGQQLLKAMAPEIILQMLSDSELFSALCERNGSFRWVSNSCLKLYGYPPEEFVKMNGWSSIHEDDIKTLLLINRDHKDRVRMTFRRRRKDGTYVTVRSYGIYREGFFFFQEQEVKEDIILTGNMHFNQIVSGVFSTKNKKIGESDVFDLISIHQDISNHEPFKPCNLKQALSRIVTYGVELRNSQGSHVRFRATFTGFDETNTPCIVLTNEEKLVWVLKRYLRDVFSNPLNSDIHVLVSISREMDDIICDLIISSHILSQTDDLSFEVVSAFVRYIHSGALTLDSVGAFQRLKISIRFRQPQGTESEEACLIVDDDPTVLLMLSKKLAIAWKSKYARSSLNVIRASTAQQAFGSAQSFSSHNKFAFVIVDLNLNEDSVATGEETIKKLKEMNCANKYIILSATVDSRLKERLLQFVDFVYEKGSSELFDSL